jgi:hypothetical protein
MSRREATRLMKSAGQGARPDDRFGRISFFVFDKQVCQNVQNIGLRRATQLVLEMMDIFQFAKGSKFVPCHVPHPYPPGRSNHTGQPPRPKPS